MTDLDRLMSTTEKAFQCYLKMNERIKATVTKESPIGSWSLNFKAGHRADRYLKLRKHLETLGGSFRGRPHLNKQNNLNKRT